MRLLNPNKPCVEGIAICVKNSSEKRGAKVMAEVMQSTVESNYGGMKRKTGKNKSKMAKKRQRAMPESAGKKVKIDNKMRKLFQRRARDYNSDGEDDDETKVEKFDEKYDEFEDEEVEERGFEEADEVSEDEDGGIQPGVMKFTGGIKAFKLAFKKISAKKSGDDSDALGPVLSAHKKLLGEKLAEKESEKRVKGEVKKEKQLKGEKGHVKPANFLDAHEKLLLGVATKGVVKLFNAVNKAQNAQKGLNPSRTKDEKIIRKRRKEAFFSELGKGSSQSEGVSTGTMNGEAPAWAPLRDNYMLTNPKLKDWDKMQDTSVADDFGRRSDADSSSDED